MKPEVRTTPLEYTISGHSLRHDPAKRFGEEILALLGRVWPVIKAAGIPNDGINRVVYEGDCTVFAGVVLGGGGEGGGAETMPGVAGLERKTVRLARYAVWKHIGPYHLLPATGAAMTKAIEAAGLRIGWPMVEVYGHWTSDESQLETETFVAVH
jgi:hypothetical protein